MIAVGANHTLRLLNLGQFLKFLVIEVAVHFDTFLQLLDLGEVEGGPLMREQAEFLGATAVGGELFELAVLHDYRYVEVAHSRELNGLFYQIAEALALEVDALQPIVYLGYRLECATYNLFHLK